MNTLKQPQQSDTQRIAIHNGKTSNNNTKAYIRNQRACGVVLLIIAILSRSIELHAMTIICMARIIIQNRNNHLKIVQLVDTYPPVSGNRNRRIL